MKNGIPQTGMNRPSMIPVSSGSVQSPIQHHSPMQHAVPPRPIMGSIPQQMTPGMSPAMVQMMAQQQQQSSQQSSMMSQSQQQQMTLPAQQQMPILSQPPMPQAFSKPFLCRLGADIVQDIVSKALELFQHLRSMTPHFSSLNQQCEDKKNKIKDTTKYIENSLKKLRKIYEACNEVCSSIDYVDPKSLLPLKDEDDSEEEKDKDEDGMIDEPETVSSTSTSEEKKNNPKLQQLEKDYNDLIELNKLKNRQLKEIIDRIRKLVWDINTMLAMRRP